MRNRIKGFWNDETGTVSVELVLLGFAFLSLLSFVEVLGANTLNLFDQLHTSQIL